MSNNKFKEIAQSFMSSIRSDIQFLLTELFVFICQIFIFFMVAVLFSCFFRNDAHLIEIVKSKLNTNTWPEFGFTLVSITITLGLLTFISRITNSKHIENIIEEVLNEIPRTIYFVGSTICAMTCALGFRNAMDHTEIYYNQYFGIAFLMAFLTYCYGCTTKYLLSRNRHRPSEDGK